jgi:hypothetical protein
MDSTQTYQEQQEAKRLQNSIASFLEDCRVGTLLNGSGIRKLRGAKPLAVFTAIFSLPFGGVNFFRGIVNNPSLGFQKDAAYGFLKNPRYNWRKFLLDLATVVVRFMEALTSGQREKALIIDDSTYDRSRSKMVELLAWIHDHNANRSLKGFRLLTLGWSDGVSFLPLDFVLCSSAKAGKRLQEIRKELDKRCCGYKRRQEAMVKSTQHLETMIKRVLARGIRADYLLMDSWFAFPSFLATLGKHLPVICMAKDIPKVLYRHQGQWLTLGRLFAALKKRPGKARIPASVVVTTAKGQQVKVVFVRHRHKREWLAILSTKTGLADEEIVRIYGKRWDIEVFFKMMKHHLNLERETQLRDFDGIIGHITIIMSRYIFLAFEQRCHDDPRTLGSLFFACCEEQKDLSLAEAMQRLLTLALEKVRNAGTIAEDAILTVVDAVMSLAIDMLRTGKRLSCINNITTTS